MEGKMILPHAALRAGVYGFERGTGLPGCPRKAAPLDCRWWNCPKIAAPHLRSS